MSLLKVNSIQAHTGTSISVNSQLNVSAISATTYYNLPIGTEVYVTGGTYNNGSATFTNNTGGTFNVTGFKTSDIFVTGGTYSSGTATFTNNTGGTFNVSGFKTSDVFVTGGTYNNGTTTFINNTGGTFNVNGYYTGATDVYITGLTFNPSNYDLTISRNDGNTFTQSLGVLSSDMVVTGGTYNSSNGIATFTNNSGSSFNVSGFLTGMTDTYVTGGTYNHSNGIATFTNNSGSSFNISGFTIPSINGTFLSVNDASWTINPVGGFAWTLNNNLVSGDYSAQVTVGRYVTSTYVDEFSTQYTLTYPVLSSSYNSGTNKTTIVPDWGTFGYQPIVSNSGPITITGQSASLNFSYGGTDIFVTGGTYSSGTATFTNSTGGTFNVTGFSAGGGDNYWTSGSTGSYSVKTINDSNLDATGDYSYAQGYLTTASGDYSYAQGYLTTASGNYSHSEGYSTTASGNTSHAEGAYTNANGFYSHAEGAYTNSNGNYSHAEGNYTTAIGGRSHAQGWYTIASGITSHASGSGTTAGGNYSFVHGVSSQANGEGTIVLGNGITGTSTNTVYVNDLVIDNLKNAAGLSTDANGKIIVTPSDERLKENITDLSNSLNKVNNLRGVSFNFVEDVNVKGTKLGFIAQEVNEVLPILVKKLPNNEDMLTVDYIGMIPVLVEAIKELTKQNLELQERLNKANL